MFLSAIVLFGHTEADVSPFCCPFYSYKTGMMSN